MHPPPAMTASMAEPAFRTTADRGIIRASYRSGHNRYETMNALTVVATVPACRCHKRLPQLNMWSAFPSPPPHWEELSRTGIQSTSAEIRGPVNGTRSIIPIAPRPMIHSWQCVNRPQGGVSAPSEPRSRSGESLRRYRPSSSRSGTPRSCRSARRRRSTSSTSGSCAASRPRRRPVPRGTTTASTTTRSPSPAGRDERVSGSVAASLGSTGESTRKSAPHSTS